MARPSGPSSTAGRKAPAASIVPFGSSIRASISKKAGTRGLAARTTGWKWKLIRPCASACATAKRSRALASSGSVSAAEAAAAMQQLERVDRRLHRGGLLWFLCLRLPNTVFLKCS